MAKLDYRTMDQLVQALESCTDAEWLTNQYYTCLEFRNASRLAGDVVSSEMWNALSYMVNRRHDLLIGGLLRDIEEVSG